MPGATPTLEEAFARRLMAWRPLLYAVSLFAAVSCTALYLQFTADDAFLSFRYGLNLVAHRTWNWNPSGPREEAYTSAVYAALSAVPALLRLSQPLFFKLLGAACVAAMALRVRRFAASPFAAALGVLVLAVHPFVWIHGYSGLETPLYMLLILEMALAVHRAAEASPAWVYTLALLLPLTRPEGLLFACGGVLLFWHQRNLLQSKGKPAPKQLALFAAAVSAGAVYFLLRWHYFHRLLPNPAYVKLQPAPLHVLLNNLFDNLYQSEWYFFTVLIVFLLAKHRTTRVFALMSFAMMLFLFAPHAMAMNFADRFYFQLTLPVVLLFLVTEDVLANARIAALLSAVFVLGISPSFLKSSLSYFPDLLRGQGDIGRRLAPFAPGHTMLTGEAGILPYTAGWVSYDLFGLGTNEFANHTPTQGQLQALRPDLILIFANHPGPAILEEPRPAVDPTSVDAANLAVLDYLSAARRQYGYAGSSRCNGFYLISFLRNDTPNHDAILAALEQNTVTSAEIHLSLRKLLLQQYVPWSR